MYIKLSELKNDDMLLVGENLIISKEDYMKEMREHEGESVYTTTKYKANIDAKCMLETAIDNEACNMYEDWECDVWEDITEKDITELQNILDRILSESRSTSYIKSKKVILDIELEKVL